MSSLLRPDDLRAPENAVEALAMLASRALRSAKALAACAAVLSGRDQQAPAVRIENRLKRFSTRSTSLQHNARTIP